MSFTFSIKTLGCKLNQLESQKICEELEAAGFVRLNFGDKTDFVIINTCTLTDKSDTKCFNFIRKSARLAGSGGVVVTGCLVENRSDLLKNTPGVSAVIGNCGKAEFALNLKRQIDLCGTVPEPQRESLISRDRVFRTRSSIKIQDGCGGSCSYCIVPAVRGKPSSRDYNVILREASELVQKGVPEIVLSGITIGSYWNSGRDLAGLIEGLLDIKGDFIIRVSSIEPLHVTDRLLELFSHPGLAPHMHIPVQSGSDAVLKSMGRPYTAAALISLIEKIRKRYQFIAIGTDLITGFPAEGPREFAETLDALKIAGFSYIHQFTFSPRAGTPAANMEQRNSPSVLRERAGAVRELSRSSWFNYRKQFEGRILRTVIERKKTGDFYRGVTANYIKVDVPDNGKSGLACKAVDLIITGISGERTLGKLNT